ASAGLTLPFALDNVEVYGACTATMWALIRGPAEVKVGSGVRKLDIDLCDETGMVLVRMQGLAFRVLALGPPLPAVRAVSGGSGTDRPKPCADTVAPEGKERIGVLMLEPYWQERDISEGAVAPAYAHHLAILCELGPEWDDTQNGA